MSDLFTSVKKENDLPSYFLVDTDFISALYANEPLMEGCLEFLKNKVFLLEPLISFEFLRDNYLAKAIKEKKDFLASLCTKVESHNEITKNINEIAENLSKIYAMKGLAGQASYVDLYLAAQGIKYAGQAAIITGNNKHYPSFIFNRIGVINYQGDNNKDQQIKVYGILLPNIENYHKFISQIPK